MHRYVFVGGLHRSGTSVLARMIAALPGVSAIRDAPVPENEGCYLQGAIPHTALHGRPMHFATDPAQHMTEGHPLDRLETRLRLEADWQPWFDPAQPWRVEKSPVNLTRMRLYQQLFPLSQFVVIIRHPEAVAASVAKWVDDPAPALIDHWIAAHRQLRADLDHLHAAMVLRYEDLVARPDRAMAALAAFLDVGTAPLPQDLHDGNAATPAPRLSAGQAARVACWGYGPGLATGPHVPHVTHPLRRLREGARDALA